MLIMNEVVRDGRVIREARTVARFADLTVVGLDRGHFATDEQAISRDLGFPVRLARLGRYAKLPRNALGYALRYWKAIREMVRIGRSVRPEVIHAHERDSLPVARRIRRKCPARVIYDCHELYRDVDYGMLGPLWRLWNRVEDRGMREADATIACNHFRARIMHEEYGAPALPMVVRNVQPHQEYRPCDVLRRRMAEQDPQVRALALYQGGIGPGRSMDVLIRALSKLPAHVGLVLVGPGKAEYIDSLRKLAAEEHVESRLLIHPPVDQRELFELTCSADVGVVIYRNTSRNNLYCAPNKLYEYAAAGLPMAAADLPPISEFIEQYRCGVLMDPDSPQSCADALERLLADPAELASMRERALAAGKVECWENEQHRLIEVYEKVLGRPIQA